MRTKKLIALLALMNAPSLFALSSKEFLESSSIFLISAIFLLNFASIVVACRELVNRDIQPIIVIGIAFLFNIVGLSILIWLTRNNNEEHENPSSTLQD